MTRDEVLKKIKKHYSENFSHLCRDLFPTLLEDPDNFYNIITDSFAFNPYLYDDIVNEELEDDFKDFIFSKNKIKEAKVVTSSKTPAELLKEVGYTLYECHCEADIQEFKRYYAPGEDLCTFNGHRLDRCHVFFAVKDNVDEIIRENFKNPKRQDEYGTSVISIQFTRGSNNTLSIKNRYNHTVNNPDATFSNNLDNIVPGLTEAFNREYNLKTIMKDCEFEIDDYVQDETGKFYRYNYEINNIFYCSGNIIIDNYEVKHFENEKFIVLDYFILDLQNKTIKLYDSTCEESFHKTIGEIHKLSQTVDPKTKNRIITINDDIEIITDNLNRIISYKNNHLKEINDAFLNYNETLNNIEILNTETIGHDFLCRNLDLKSIDLPNVKQIGNDFFSTNREIIKVNLPKVEEIGDDFLSLNRDLPSIDLPKVKEIGNSFLERNMGVKSIDFPLLERVGACFFFKNYFIEDVNLPSLRWVGNSFFSNNSCIESISLPSATIIGSNFIINGESLKEINLPNVASIGDNFLKYNTCLESICLPKVEFIENNFLQDNKVLSKIYMPLLVEVKINFLYSNLALTDISFPNLRSVGGAFIFSNSTISSAYIPELVNISYSFLHLNKELKRLSLENVECIKNDFLEYNNKLEEINMPKVQYIGDRFLVSNKILKSISLPEVLNIGDYFLEGNEILDEIYLPKAMHIGKGFLLENNTLKNLDLPNAVYIGEFFMKSNTLKSINIPNIERFSSHALSSTTNKFFKMTNAILVNMLMNSNRKLRNVNGFKVYNNFLLEKISNDISKLI